jgi:hypothetical protein
MGLEDIDDDILPPPKQAAVTTKGGGGKPDLSDIFGDLGIPQKTAQQQHSVPSAGPPPRAAAQPADALAGFFSDNNTTDNSKPLPPSVPQSFDSLFEFSSSSEKKKHVDIRNESERYLEAWTSGGGVRRAEPTLGQMKAPSTAAVTAQLLALMNFYDVLGVDKNASVDDIRRSYKKKALELHPDKVGRQQTPEEAQLFKTITKAHDVLTDPIQRKEYDSSLTASTQTSWFSHLSASSD